MIDRLFLSCIDGFSVLIISDFIGLPLIPIFENQYKSRLCENIEMDPLLNLMA